MSDSKFFVRKNEDAGIHTVSVSDKKSIKFEDSCVVEVDTKSHQEILLKDPMLIEVNPDEWDDKDESQEHNE